MFVLPFAVQTSVKFYHTSVQKKRMSGHIDGKLQVASGKSQKTCNL